MSYAPADLKGLQSYLAEHTGLPLISLGIVGDSRHSTGYHLGRDRLLAGDYSIRTARDRAGVTDAASAIDIGSWPELRAFSRWFVARCRAGAPGTRDVREVIYSPDGELVLRYDRERGVNSDPRPGEADSSHRSHTHISFYRDSRERPKARLVRPFFEEADDMPAVTWHALPGGVGSMTLHPDRGLVDLVTGRRYVPDDKTKPTYSRGDAEGIGKGYVCNDAGHACLALEDGCTFTPAVPPAPATHYRLELNGATVAEGDHPSP